MPDGGQLARWSPSTLLAGLEKLITYRTHVQIKALWFISAGGARLLVFMPKTLTLSDIINSDALRRKRQASRIDNHNSNGNYISKQRYLEP